MSGGQITFEQAKQLMDTYRKLQGEADGYNPVKDSNYSFKNGGVFQITDSYKSGIGKEIEKIYGNDFKEFYLMGEDKKGNIILYGAGTKGIQKIGLKKKEFYTYLIETNAIKYQNSTLGNIADKIEQDLKQARVARNGATDNYAHAEAA